jgi:hypothetical protein
VSTQPQPSYPALWRELERIRMWSGSPEALYNLACSAVGHLESVLEYSADPTPTDSCWCSEFGVDDENPQDPPACAHTRAATFIRKMRGQS